MAPRFADLPPELLVNITSHLTTVDYGNVRRTCSTVEMKLFDSFGKEFFKRKQFMLTQSSLQALIDISNHDALRGYMTKVIIGTNVVPDLGRAMDYHSHPYIPTSYSADPQTQVWQREQFLDQAYFMKQGLGAPMLTEALNNLPSCHEIEIRDSYCPTRGRGDERWTSYGSTEFLKRSGLTKWQWWSEKGHATDHMNYTFSAVTRAMATSKTRQFTALMMTTRLVDNDLGEDAFYRSNLFNFADAFKSIVTLMIPLRTRGGHPNLTDFGSFLRLFPNLNHLRLNGTPSSNCSDWLNVAKDAIASCPIRKLDLGKMRMLPDVFKDFLSSLKKLEHLELHRLTLVGSWANTFSELHNDLPHLNVLKINMIISGSDAYHHHIGFKSSEEALAKTAVHLTPTMEFKGSNWLDQLTGRLVVEDLTSLGLSSDNSSEDSDTDSGSDELDPFDVEDLLDESDIDEDDDDDMELDDEE